MTKHFTITVIIYLTVYSSKELLNVYWLDLIGSVVETIHQKIFTGAAGRTNSTQGILKITFYLICCIIYV